MNPHRTRIRTMWDRPVTIADCKCGWATATHSTPNAEQAAQNHLAAVRLASRYTGDER